MPALTLTSWVTIAMPAYVYALIAYRLQSQLQSQQLNDQANQITQLQQQLEVLQAQVAAAAAAGGDMSGHADEHLQVCHALQLRLLVTMTLKHANDLCNVAWCDESASCQSICNMHIRKAAMKYISCRCPQFNPPYR